MKFVDKLDYLVKHQRLSPSDGSAVRRIDFAYGLYGDDLNKTVKAAVNELYKKYTKKASKK